MESAIQSRIPIYIYKWKKFVLVHLGQRMLKILSLYEKIHKSLRRPFYASAILEKKTEKIPSTLYNTLCTREEKTQPDFPKLNFFKSINQSSSRDRLRKKLSFSGFSYKKKKKREHRKYRCGISRCISQDLERKRDKKKKKKTFIVTIDRVKVASK